MVFAANPDFADGIASSVKAGIAAVPAEADGAVICLGDMPLVDAGLIDRLIDALAPDKGALIAVPAAEGRRGNPVLWSRRFFDELMTLEGDVGARHMIARHAEAVTEVETDGQSAFWTSTPGGVGIGQRATAGPRSTLHEDLLPSSHEGRREQKDEKQDG